MGVFKDAIPKFVAAFDSAQKLGDTVKSITYHAGADTYEWRLIRDKVKFTETDGTTVKITDSKWLGLQSEIPELPKPLADDYFTLTGSDKRHYVIASDADPADITWQIYTKG